MLTWLQFAARVSSFYTIVPGGGDSQTSKQNLISLPVSNAAMSPKNVSHEPWGPHAHAMMTWVSLSHGPTPPPATSEMSYISLGGRRLVVFPSSARFLASLGPNVFRA